MYQSPSLMEYLVRYRLDELAREAKGDRLAREALGRPGGQRQHAWRDHPTAAAAGALAVCGAALLLAAARNLPTP
jgi:hypothetical protein